MNTESLKSLKPREKAADIQEYHYGVNGWKLVYKVTVYSCKKILFWKHIFKYTFPFYFASKDIAEKFLEQYEKFDLDIEFYNVKLFSSISSKPGYILKPKGIKKPKYQYWMVDSYNTIGVPSNPLHIYEGDVWAGYVNYFGKLSSLSDHDNILFYEIYHHEKEAAYEGTTGKTFSYKLQSIE